MPAVLVTGASGFIAKHIVRELLERGYDVRAGVRSERGRAQVEALFPESSLEFVSLDLLEDDGWDDAMRGVDVLMHTASPFPSGEPKDPETLIRPAVDGTMRALVAAHANGVRRVILTSSCAAIYKPAGADPTRPKTHADWTDPDGEDTSAYEASKTLAERAAWDFVAEHPEMALTTVNPGMVYGPPMDEHYGSSLELVAQFATGLLPAYPRMNMPGVDVRDVARIHVGAIENDATVGQRLPANAGALYLSEIAGAIGSALPDKRISTAQLPTWLVKALAPVVPVLRYAGKNLAYNGEVDGSDAPRMLGFEYIPTRDAVAASATYLAASR